MDLTYILIMLFAGLWIVYRVFFAKQFLLWDWQDGQVKYFWNTPDWRKHEDAYFGKNHDEK